MSTFSSRFTPVVVFLVGNDSMFGRGEAVTRQKNATAAFRDAVRALITGALAANCVPLVVCGTCDRGKQVLTITINVALSLTWIRLLRLHGRVSGSCHDGAGLYSLMSPH
jgi:hypothetical protein